MLSFGISRLICSYLIGSSQNFLEKIFTRNFLGIEVVLKLYLLIGDGGGSLWKDSSLLTHYSCCWVPL